MKHIKNYIKYFDLSEDSFVPCEVCGGTGVDLHHIVYKSREQSEDRDNVENVISLCRNCHDRSHFKKKPYLYAEELKKIHFNFIKRHG